jgi:hypothetical protein
MSGTLAALRQAAAVLLAEAPLPVVRATLRGLLTDTDRRASGKSDRATAAGIGPESARFVSS